MLLSVNEVCFHCNLTALHITTDVRPLSHCKHGHGLALVSEDIDPRFFYFVVCSVLFIVLIQLIAAIPNKPLLLL